MAGWGVAEEHFASNIYYDGAFKCEAAKLLPGEYYYTSKDMVLVTVLGSCVSACLRDPVSGVGGMNHFMLPDPGYQSDQSGVMSMRYGNYAMDILIDELLSAGARLDRLEGKLFGGGNVLKNFGQIHVGSRNATFAVDYLKQRKIRLLASDLNGDHPRKVYFFPRTGKVFVRKIRELRNDTVVQREQEYANRLVQVSREQEGGK